MNKKQIIKAGIVVLLGAFTAVEFYENNVKHFSLFQFLFNPTPIVSTQGPEPSELEKKLRIVLGNQGFSADFSKIVITCVDPKYPASSADPDELNPVNYNSHHVQQAPPSDAQVSLKYDARGNFIPIPQEAVHDSLNQGVVQLDQHVTNQNLITSAIRTVVIGIPGDCYAFNQSGTGFSFNNPGYAQPQIAEQLLEALIRYSSSDNIQFYAMAHPDCGLFANNVGKRKHELIETAKTLEQDLSSYPSSSYARVERLEKKKGADHLKIILSRYSKVKEVHIVLPQYQARTPGIVNALHSAH